MILIADSGSTKTDWCLSDKGKTICNVQTGGINPFFQTENEIRKEIETSLAPKMQPYNIDSVHFYGAGCAFPEKNIIVENAIRDSLQTDCHVEINSDMLGAARALCGHRPGIACIIGTGSNSCFYNGKTIEKNVSPLGFIIGDEGSGAWLGKILTGDILKNQTSAKLKESFLAFTGMTTGDIIDRIYRKPFPNRFLASLSPFILSNIEEPYIRNIVYSGFESFIKRNVMQYDYMNYKVNFTGSVAYYYREILEEVCHNLGIILGKIDKNPIKGLTEYHSV